MGFNRSIDSYYMIDLIKLILLYCTVLYSTLDGNLHYDIKITAYHSIVQFHRRVERCSLQFPLSLTKDLLIGFYGFCVFTVIINK